MREVRRGAASAAALAAVAALALAAPAQAKLYGCAVETSRVVNDDGSLTLTYRDCSTDPSNPDFPNDPDWPRNPDDPEGKPGNPYPASRYLPQTTEWEEQYAPHQATGTGPEFTFTETGPTGFTVLGTGTRYDGKRITTPVSVRVPGPHDARQDMTWSLPAAGLAVGETTFYLTTAKTHLTVAVVSGIGSRYLTQVSAVAQPDGRTTYGFRLDEFVVTGTPEPVTIEFEAWTDNAYDREMHNVESAITSLDCLVPLGPAGLVASVQRTARRLLVTPELDIRAFCPYTGYVTEQVSAILKRRRVEFTRLELPFGPLKPPYLSADADTPPQPTATQRTAIALPRKYRKRPIQLRLTWFAETPDRSDQLRVRQTYCVVDGIPPAKGPCAPGAMVPAGFHG